MKRSRITRTWALLAAVMLVVAACGPGGGAATQTPTPAPTQAPTEAPTQAPTEAPTQAPTDAATQAPTEAPTGGTGFTPEYVDGKLQPLPDGFPNQPLTFIVVDEAGSDDGIYARAFQKAMTPLSPVRVEVVDRPDLGANFGTWEALRWVSEQRGGNEGYLLTVASVTGTTLDLIQTPEIRTQLGASLETENWVRVTEQVPWLMVSRTGAPWGNSLQQFVDHAKANPGEVRWISRGTGSAVTFAFAHYQRLLGIELNEIIGGSIEDVLLAVGAGAGDVAMNVTGSTMPFVQDGKVVVISCTGNTNPCPGFPHATNAATLAGIQGNDPWGSSRGLIVPPEVDPLHRAWVSELLRKASEDPEFQQQREQLPGLVIVDFDHDKAVELSEFIYRTGYELLQEAGELDPSIPSPPPAG